VTDTRVRWFGQHWGAPCCDDTNAVPTPVGEPCCLCRKPILVGDDGFLSLYFGAKDPPHIRPIHYNCELLNLGAQKVKPDKPDKPDKPTK
jgi:hypothetical protein